MATIHKKGERLMKTIETAIETMATINTEHQLVLDEPLPVSGPARVRVIVLLPEQADIEEREWLLSGTNNDSLVKSRHSRVGGNPGST